MASSSIVKHALGIDHISCLYIVFVTSTGSDMSHCSLQFSHRTLILDLRFRSHCVLYSCLCILVGMCWKDGRECIRKMIGKGSKLSNIELRVCFHHYQCSCILDEEFSVNFFSVIMTLHCLPPYPPPPP